MLKEVQERLEHSDIEMTMNESTLFNDLIKINCAKISEVHLAMKCGRVVNIVSSGQKLFSQIKKTLSI